MWLVSINTLFVFPQTMQLIFKSTVKTHTDGGDGVKLTLDPRPDCVSFFGELTSKHFVVLLFSELALQGGVSLRYQLPDFAPFSSKVLKCNGDFVKIFHT